MGAEHGRVRGQAAGKGALQGGGFACGKIDRQGTAVGGGEYDVGTTVTLVATPAEGYRFARWLDPYNNVVTEAETYSFVVYDPDGDPLTPTTIIYTAVFDPIVVEQPVEEVPVV